MRRPHPSLHGRFCAALFALATLGLLIGIPHASLAGKDRVYVQSYGDLTEEERRELEESLEEALSHLDGLGEEISHLVETALADLEVIDSGDQIVIRGLPHGDHFEFDDEEFERRMEAFGERFGDRMSRLAERLARRFDSDESFSFEFDDDAVEGSVADLERRMLRLKRELEALERELERRGY